jgi:hypothetical protein
MKIRYILAILSPWLLWAQTPHAIDKTLKLSGIAFHLRCDNNASINRLTITPKGLSGDNRPITQELDGTIIGNVVADLNRDGSPELYVFVTGSGSGSYGQLVAYSTNHNRSLSEIVLPDLSADTANSTGYMGHDTFMIDQDRLVRSFPLYQKSDPACCPTGGIRHLYYRLKAGQNSWQLTLEKSTMEKKN